MSTYSLEDFYLKTITEKLEKSKYSLSSWERNAEKSSTWFSYLYIDCVLLGKLHVYFDNETNENRIIPLKCHITFDTYVKREYGLPWFETVKNNIYTYSCSVDLNNENSFNLLLNKILEIIPPKKNKTLWSYF